MALVHCADTYNQAMITKGARTVSLHITHSTDSKSEERPTIVNEKQRWSPLLTEKKNAQCWGCALSFILSKMRTIAWERAFQIPLPQRGRGKFIYT